MMWSKQQQQQQLQQQQQEHQPLVVSYLCKLLRVLPLLFVTFRSRPWVTSAFVIPSTSITGSFNVNNNNNDRMKAKRLFPNHTFRQRYAVYNTASDGRRSRHVRVGSSWTLFSRNRFDEQDMEYARRQLLLESLWSSSPSRGNVNQDGHDNSRSSSSRRTDETTRFISLQWSGRIQLPIAGGEAATSSILCMVLTEASSSSSSSSTQHVAANRSWSSAAVPVLVVPVLQDQSGGTDSFAELILSVLSMTAAAARFTGDEDEEDLQQQQQLLLQQQRHQPLSRTVLWTLNAALLMNQDDGLYDNLPYTTWTDRQLDAAGNPILPRFHMGKRTMYNHMMMMMSMSTPSNFPAGLIPPNNHFASSSTRSTTRRNERNAGLEEEEESIWLSSSSIALDWSLLTRRIVQLQLQEAEMAVAEWDAQLAVARQERHDDDAIVVDLDQQRRIAQDQVQQLRQQWQELVQDQKQQRKYEQSQSSASSVTTPSDAKNRIPHFLTSLIEFLDPKPVVSTKNSSSSSSDTTAPQSLPQIKQPGRLSPVRNYPSPFHMMADAIRDQFQAEIIGAVLENISLLDGTTVFGGAIVLRRIVPMKTVTIIGETIQVPVDQDDADLDDDTDKDDDEDTTVDANQNTQRDGRVVAGQTVIVECKIHEAVGMSFACDLPLQVVADVWDRARIMARPTTLNPNNRSQDASNRLWELDDPELFMFMEGQGSNQSSTRGRAAPIRIPRSTGSLWDAVVGRLQQEPGSLSSSKLYPDDNPIQSLDQYDALSTEDKARTLMSISNFNGKLPRRRVVQQDPNVLDNLLLPLVDESVRRQVQLRDAQRRGDWIRVQELEQSKSIRQVALENVHQARLLGLENVAQQWQDEAELFASLRADITQDEGNYSRYLDRDEWYERERQQMVERIRRSQEKKQMQNKKDPQKPE